MMNNNLIPKPGDRYRDAHGSRYIVYSVERAYDRKRKYVSIHLRDVGWLKRKRKARRVG
jgi:hypothetical protein